MELMVEPNGIRSRQRIEGRYHVQSRSLRLNGIGSPPHEFWVVRSAGDRCLIETTEEDSYWIACEELTRALSQGWIVKEREDLW